jgi:16S rRNA (cytosine1402-N4)-methyltransferase
MTIALPHVPVMLREVLTALKPKNGCTYVDATFGNGGYTQAVLDSADCRVIAIDRDPTVLTRAQEFKNRYGQRFEFRAGCFADIDNLIETSVDGFMFDIGVSSMQLDQAERGFSFMHEGKLDMRMSCEGMTAADIVNTYGESDLADLIYLYGEEKKSRAVARQIVAARAQKPIETTTELADIVRRAVCQSGKTDPATRTFQALRIAVNGELEQLRRGLAAATEKLRPAGRLVVVDFHSLEDRIVKNFFKENVAKACHVSRYKKVETEEPRQAFVYTSKVLIPQDDECARNPRARSAKLRYAVKTGADKND